MHRLLVPALALLLLLGACQPDAEAPAEAPVAEETTAAAPGGYEAVGEPIMADDALSVATVLADPTAYVGQTVTLEGEVSQVCQMKGCWLTFAADAGEPIRILVPRTDDGYVYTFPKDISGRRVIVQGTLEAETLTAAEQRHLAEDAGTPLDGDVAPRLELTMTAHGALVEKPQT